MTKTRHVATKNPAVTASVSPAAWGGGRVSPRASRLEHMQTAFGNQGMLSLLAVGTLRRKQKINQSGEVQQHEADHGGNAAAPVTQAAVTQPAVTSTGSAGILRRCSCGKSDGGGQCEECKAKAMHRKENSGGSSVTVSSGVTAPPIVHQALNSPGRPLDAGTRSFMEPRFGRDLGGVRIHTDHRAAESAQAVDALAYTVGQDVVFAAGQYAPQTPAGTRLLAHELAHTLQSGGSGRVFPFLEVGRVDDPAERAADQSADAVLRGEKVSLPPAAGGVLRRQRACTADTTDRADQRLVHCEDGDYRVTMTTTPSRPSPHTHAAVSAGWNNSDIYLTVDVCRGGTEVVVTPSVDLPRAVGQALGNVLAGSPVLSGANLTGGLNITVVQSDSFTLSLAPRVTVDPRGVSGVGGGVTVTTPDISVGGDVTYDPRTRAGFLTFTFSGGSTQPHVRCHRLGQPYAVFTCERITHIPRTPAVPEHPYPDEVRYIFFEYPTANIRRDFQLPTDIQSLHDHGYQVSSILGFTSPEGPRKRETRSFEGNIALGQERADAALTWLQNEACPTCDLSNVPHEGRSELPPQLGAVEPEPRGPRMERAAVEEFLGAGAGQTPDPLAPHTPEELAAFRQLPPAAQREWAFQRMRRAEIRFHHAPDPAQPEVPARDDPNPVDCPQSAIEAARLSFGVTVATGAIPRRR